MFRIYSLEAIIRKINTIKAFLCDNQDFKEVYLVLFFILLTVDILKGISIKDPKTVQEIIKKMKLFILDCFILSQPLES